MSTQKFFDSSVQCAPTDSQGRPLKAYCTDDFSRNTACFYNYREAKLANCVASTLTGIGDPNMDGDKQPLNVYMADDRVKWYGTCKGKLPVLTADQKERDKALEIGWIGYDDRETLEQELASICEDLTDMRVELRGKWGWTKEMSLCESGLLDGCQGVKNFDGWGNTFWRKRERPSWWARTTGVIDRDYSCEWKGLTLKDPPEGSRSVIKAKRLGGSDSTIAAELKKEARFWGHKEDCNHLTPNQNIWGTGAKFREGSIDWERGACSGFISVDDGKLRNVARGACSA